MKLYLVYLIFLTGSTDSGRSEGNLVAITLYYRIRTLR